MPVAFNFVQPPPNTGTGLKLDTSELTNGANVVERQNICLADPITAANVANVTAGAVPALADFGLNVALLGMVAQNTAPASLSGLPLVGIRNGTGPTVDGNAGVLQIDASGFLKVNVAAGGSLGGTSSSFAAPFPVTGTAIGFTDGVNMGAARIVAIPNPAYTNTGQLQVAVTGMNAALTSPGTPYYGLNVFAIRNGPVASGDGQTQSLITDVNGFLKVNIAAGGAAGGTSSTVGAGVPTLATAAGFSDGTLMQLGRVSTAGLATLGASIQGLIVRSYMPSDGANTMPAGDALARSLFVRIGDGTTSVGVDVGTGALKVTQTTAEQVIGYDDNGTAITAGSNRPVQVGFKAVTSINAQTLLADGNASFNLGTRDGRMVLAKVHPGDRLPTTPVTLTVTGNNTLVAAQAAGVKIALAGIAISNTSAVNTEVSIKDGTTEIGRFPAPATNGMAPVEFPVHLVGTAATVMNVAILANASSVTVTPFPYKTQL